VEVRRDWVLKYGLDDVLRSQGADPASLRARRPRLIATAEHALAQGRGLVEPAVLTRQVRVERARHNQITLEGGFQVTGPLITKHIGGAEALTVMLCTIGNKLGEKALSESTTDTIYGFALDAVGSAAVHALSAAACNRVEQDARALGLQTSLPLSPGMEGWGVDPGQREIFSMIDPSEAGVIVSTTLQMKPLKSVTAIVGIGKTISSQGAICDYCALGDTCRQRIA